METLDLEYTPIVEPLPALAAAAEVEALRSRIVELEAKLAAVPGYAAYYAEEANEGDAPYSFEDWYGGAAEAAEKARDWATAPRIAWGDEAQP